jgi:hypothetical protein
LLTHFREPVEQVCTIGKYANWLVFGKVTRNENVAFFLVGNGVAATYVITPFADVGVHPATGFAVAVTADGSLTATDTVDDPAHPWPIVNETSVVAPRATFAGFGVMCASAAFGNTITRAVAKRNDVNPNAFLFIAPVCPNFMTL